MGKLRVKKNTKERKLIWAKLRHCIDFVILVCCLVVTFNIHPANKNVDNDMTTEKQIMIYIFHDYQGNQYILNDTIHGSADSRDYLFEDEVPDEIKLEEKDFTGSVSLRNLSTDNNKITNNNVWNSGEQTSVKNNQVSLKDMMEDLWVNNDDSWSHNIDDNQMVIDVQNSSWDISIDEPYYIVTEEVKDNNNSKLIIEKVEDTENITPLKARTFTFTSDWWIVPILVYRDELNLNKQSNTPIAYIDNSGSTYGWNSWNWNRDKKTSWSGVTIIEEYANCMTPWWYKIDHWDSVLAYQQMDNAPNICNIERRFCRNGKLSWTYTQQWCSVNENYTYEKWGEAIINNDNSKNTWKEWDLTQNPDWSVKVNKPLWTWSFVFDRPSQTSTPDYYVSDNYKIDEEVEQTKRPHRDCTAPRGEKVKHGQFVQAFKHANWFADAPCEMQIRLCSMWNLMWTYTESTCKTWEAYFIDWVNWYPNWDKSSKEKIEWIKEQIKNEQIDYENTRKNAKRSTKTDQLDKILYILDEN